MPRHVHLQEAEPPRLLNEGQTAHKLGWSASGFSRRARDLEAIGFPRRHALLKRRDRLAIDQWLDEQFGLASAPRDVDALIKERLAALGAGK